MSNSFISAMFTFSCANAEMALLVEAFRAADDFCHNMEPARPSPEFLAVFPPGRPQDAWSGFLAHFAGRPIPYLGARISGGNRFETPHRCEVLITGKDDFLPDPVARLIRACCQETLKSGPIGFEWAGTCSIAVPGEFEGGRCAIFPDRIEYESTRQAATAALDGDIL